jgi:hypothetical protein
MADPCLPLRAQHDAIVTNRVLRVLSHTYGLEKRLLAAESEGLALSRNASIQADLFESYLGGVQTQLGEEAAEAWIRGVIGPMIPLAYKDRKEASALMEEAKRQLRRDKKDNRPSRIQSGTATPVGTTIEDMDEIVYPRNSCVPRHASPFPGASDERSRPAQAFGGSDDGSSAGQGRLIHKDGRQCRRHLPRRAQGGRA